MLRKKAAFMIEQLSKDFFILSGAGKPYATSFFFYKRRHGELWT